MRKVLWILSVILLTGGLVYLWLVCDGYQKGRDEYKQFNQNYIQAGSDDRWKASSEHENESEIERESDMKAKTGAEKKSIVLPKDAPEKKTVDFSGLRKINPEVVAWIDLPAIDVSYPIVQAEDNEFYLHRDIYREYLFAGSIFLDAYNDPSFANMNSIIYGHNMRDESMFGRLDALKIMETVEAMPYFWIYTPDASFLYRIFSVHSAVNGSSAFTLRFRNTGDYENWLNRMRESSCVDLGADLSVSDSVVTLSTCTGNASEKCVVHGYRIAAVR